MFEEEPYTDRDRVLASLRDMERSLDRILKELEGQHGGQHGRIDIGPIMIGLGSISRAVWILTWIAIGGTLVAILRAL